MIFFFFKKNEKEENGTRRINIVYKKILNETKIRRREKQYIKGIN